MRLGTEYEILGFSGKDFVNWSLDWLWKGMCHILLRLERLCSFSPRNNIAFI